MQHHNSTDINSLIICGPGQPQRRQPPQRTPAWGLLQRNSTGPQKDLQLSTSGGSNCAQQPTFLIGSFVHWVIDTECGLKAGALRTA